MREYDELLCTKFSRINDDVPKLYTQYGVEADEGIKELITGRNLVIGLDQATKITGACIMDFDTREVLVALDLINYGFPSKYLYFESIYDFFYNLISDEKVAHFIYEIPVEHSKNMQIRKTLEAMRLFVKDFAKRIPSLSKANMVEVNIGTWRKHFLADKKYDGRRKSREDAKIAAREEAVVRCPELAPYFSIFPTPPDSCDAVGIAYGALEEIYSSTSGLRRPNKTMPKTNAGVFCKIYPLTQDELIETLKLKFAGFLPDKYELLEFNPEMSVQENCIRYACNNYTLGIIPITDAKTSQELKWETGNELKEGQLYYAFCWR